MKVAVYGTLRKNLINSFILDKSKFIEEKTLNIHYEMYDLGGFPCIIPSKNINHITIEIYEVDEKTLDNLDILEGIPYLYQKKYIREYDFFIYIMENISSEFKKTSTPIPSGNYSSYYINKRKVSENINGSFS